MAPKVLRLSQFQRHRLEAARAAKEAAFHQAATTSGKALLNIIELLELLLTHLDLKTLLLSQRVSTTWNTTIAQSRVLQEKLFFRFKTGNHKDKVNTLLVHRRVRPHKLEVEEDIRYYHRETMKNTWLYLLDLSTLPEHATARKMFIGGDGMD
nr:hypothetical protein B0A51_01731 [Rachicladosporium sp. CCFEE 5018]